MLGCVTRRNAWARKCRRHGCTANAQGITASGPFTLDRVNADHACRAGPRAMRHARPPQTERVIHCGPMSPWRRFLVIVLLVLSLPAQSLAAISMRYAAASTGELPMHDTRSVMHESGHHARLAALSGDDHRHHHPSDACRAHPCSTCSLYCSGAGLPASPFVAVAPDVRHIALAPASSAAAASFLTDGIERPPRLFLV